jgi:hypothetical protein
MRVNKVIEIDRAIVAPKRQYMDELVAIDQTEGADMAAGPTDESCSDPIVIAFLLQGTRAINTLQFFI